ncbi:Pao retrotransposon peptidase, partial [Ancylostoma caninum]
KDKEIKVLGLSWNSIDDTLSFTCTEKTQKKISKRTVLSQINGFCFDPLGLLTPLIVPVKVFLQYIHKMKLGWDMPLPDEASQQWNSIRSNIIGFSKSIPRKALEKDWKAEYILSIFVDSSKRAYACSLYVTTATEHGKVDTQLFTAKSKVAPLKKEQTIPRLELLSIFLGLGVAESTISKSGVKFASKAHNKAGTEYPYIRCNPEQALQRRIRQRRYPEKVWKDPACRCAQGRSQPNVYTSTKHSRSENRREYTQKHGRGSNQLVCELRHRFWIPKEKALCKKTVRNCVTCKKFNSAPFIYPDMGPLPKERVTQAPPFSHTGIDYMGPIAIRLTSGEDEKRHVALYKCLVTRLVHLEVAADLSAKSFLLTFKRFIARRGVPQKIISDNGTNFRLSESIRPIICKRMKEKMRKLSSELLHTTLCEIESIVNSRPLTSIGDQDSPCQFLRVDFIYKDVRLGSTQLTSSDNDEDDPDYRTTPELSSQKEARIAFSETEKLTKKFWTIWKHDYLLELRDRHHLFERRKKSTNRDPQVGDIVLLDQESQLSRCQWPMAVILELITSRDGEIRSVILRTST